ncbi:hypothetical protein NPS01_25090 [Nocardioides psychrotolerans]|uniref:Uncharacterized protein n=1 Tax=Nocardioides psychrotolerans TaxID=1005945 RepID=A0A1I3LKM1_9ACTN|nr:hypothetical protein [Nocardioides psychrotolerans]GEP38846.1 hypothetical protein NPS01_25090 [Nocardioides psychrotolerans]SFI85284.1 hypothetical protein SAMN05216561_11411 [Nocardioides psychrotolerans]
MTETSTTNTNLDLTTDQIEDIALDLLETLVDNDRGSTVDLGHILGDDTPKRSLSLVVDRNSGEWLAVTLWDDESEPDPVEIAVVHIRVERVI